jgi:hypothetical protein
MKKSDKLCSGSKNLIIGAIIGFIVLCIVYNNVDYLKTQYFRTMEYFGVIGCIQNVTVNGTNFCQIGNGPAIDRTAIRDWMGSGSINYVNHEGINLSLNAKQYRAISGFLPPSFSFFPYGINVDNYRPVDDSISILDPTKKDYNTEEGRAICMQACKDTGCIAVQTEVPQLCYEKRVQIAIPEGFGVDGGTGDETQYTTKGDCAGKATHSCTMFYKDIEKSDDAYFDLSGGISAIMDANIPFKVGIKYYENNPAPGITTGEGNTRPSEEKVKWCSSKINNIGTGYTTYKTNLDATKACTCTEGTVNCDDANCCMYRDLITTDWAKHNTPYFNLPINVTKTKEIDNGSPGAVCPAKDQNGKCCGVCPVYGENPKYDKSTGWFENYLNDESQYAVTGYDIISCPENKQYLDGTMSDLNMGGVWWALDTPRSKCMWPKLPWWRNIHPIGWVADYVNDVNADNKDMDECLEEYAAKKNSNPEEALRLLTGCCGYLDQACIDTIAQPFCSRNTGDVTRGCFGDPAILSVDNVVGSIGACDNPAIISPDNRCIQDFGGKACTGFPYSCESGPLWIIQ